jgi:hypothetical protein
MASSTLLFTQLFFFMYLPCPQRREQQIPSAVVSKVHKLDGLNTDLFPSSRGQECKTKVLAGLVLSQ